MPYILNLPGELLQYDIIQHQICVQSKHTEHFQIRRIGKCEQCHSPLHAHAHGEIEQNGLLYLNSVVLHSGFEQYPRIEYHKNQKSQYRSVVNRKITYERSENIIVHIQITERVTSIRMRLN